MWGLRDMKLLIIIVFILIGIGTHALNSETEYRSGKE